jgi:preprotein translocase subunit SecA
MARLGFSHSRRDARGASRQGDAAWLRWCGEIAAAVNALEPAMSARSDAELRALTDSYRTRLANGEGVVSLLPEAFATVRAAAARAIGRRPYDQQVMAGAALYRGAVVETPAGEGKTLAITLPAYLGALAGGGVHVLTATNHLARRDHASMRRVYEFLGMRAGLTEPEPDPAAHRTAYGADVTYGSHEEFVRDYLRDNLTWNRDERVQRGHRFGIVDEADLMLITDAFTAQYISGPGGPGTRWVTESARLAQQLHEGEHYQVDKARRELTLTRKGMDVAADWFGVTDLDAPANTALARLVRTALTAKELYREGRDYVVRGDRILGVDPNTGEVGAWRFMKGIDQALEAREGLPVHSDGQPLATMTEWGYLDVYDRLAGITSTAVTDADSYRLLYDLDVVAVPPIAPARRIRQPDALYATADAKLNALADEAAAQHLTGRPVLVACEFIRQSRQISGLLDSRGVRHVLLDPADHDREAAVIADCGHRNAVTVAAATAGRGVDSALGDGTEAEHAAIAGLGGLIVLSAERHRDERLDLRVAGRGGRRGDPGDVKFFLCYEDDTVRLMLGAREVRYLATLGGETRRAKTAEKLITERQRVVAAGLTSWRARMLRGEQIVARQRTMIYDARRAVLESGDLSGDQVRRWISEVISEHVEAAAATGLAADGLWAEFRELYPVTLTPGELAAERGCDISELPPQFVAERIAADARQAYDRREAEVTGPVMRDFERRVMLAITDRAWQDHLADIAELAESDGHPGGDAEFAVYQDQMARRFSALGNRIREETVRVLFARRPEPRP